MQWNNDVRRNCTSNYTFHSCMFVGQQIVEEILDAQRPGCPIEYFNIPVPKDHQFSEGKEDLEMPFQRTRYDSRTGYTPNNPRQQVI